MLVVTKKEDGSCYVQRNVAAAVCATQNGHRKKNCALG